LEDPAKPKKLYRHSKMGNCMALILPCLFFIFPILAGTIDSANHAVGKRRSGDRMIYHENFDSARMKKHPILEIFRPNVWPFGQRIAQEQDQEHPGIQISLPLEVIMLSENVEYFRATAVGIRKSDILHTEAARHSQ